jgi:hypothetical protein
MVEGKTILIKNVLATPSSVRITASANGDGKKAEAAWL